MTVSLVLDVLILLIAGLTVFLAWRRGFVKTIQSAAVFVLAIVITLLLRQTVASWLYRSSLPEKAEERITGVVSALLSGESEKGRETDRAGQPEDAPSFLQTALKALGIDEAQYRNLLQQKKAGTEESLRNALKETVIPKTVSVLVQAISVIGLFLVSALVLHLLFFLLRKLIESVGALRTVNRVFGLIVGILLAVFRVFLFVTVISALLRVSAISSLPVISAFHAEETWLFRWISGINPFNALFN